MTTPAQPPASTAHGSPPSSPADLSGPFVRAVEETFEKMLSSSVSVGRIVERKATTPRDVSAVVGFTGGRRGAVIISFSETTACRVISRFAGEQQDDLNAVVCDGVGEILNIIAGRAKASLAREAGPIDMSLPTVVSGREHEVHRLRDAPTLLIPFMSELGEFEVVLVMEPPASPGARVLVVDDSRVMRKLVRSALKDFAPVVDVTEAENTAKAREALAGPKPFDLVVLDLHMPDGNGATVLEELRRRPGGERIPVIIATSDTEVDRVIGEVSARVGSADVTRSLLKPFAPIDLVQLAKSLAAKRR